MNPEQIINRMNHAIENIQARDFLARMPMILDDMDFVFRTSLAEVDKLTPGQQLNSGYRIKRLAIQYAAALADQYHRMVYGEKLNIVEETDYNLSIARGQYDSKNDKIRYSGVGMLLGGSKTGNWDALHTFLHESRHKRQQDGYKIGDIAKLAHYPAQLFLLIKEDIFTEAHPDDNYKFYFDNYCKLFVEMDAEEYSLTAFKTMLEFMVDNYYRYCARHNIRVDGSVKKKYEALNAQMQKTAKVIQKENAEMGRTEKDIISEYKGDLPIISRLELDGEEIDRLIVMDKYVKTHPAIIEKYPLLKILFHDDYTPKTYAELKREFEEVIKRPEINLYDKYNLSKIFSFAIASDPMLTMEHYVDTKNYSSAFAFIIRHSSMFDEYPEELRDITDRCSDPMLNRLFNKGFNISMGTGVNA